MKNFIIITGLLALSTPMIGQQSFRVSGGHLKVSGSSHIVLHNTQWVNNGNFAAGSGTVSLSGDGTDGESVVGGSSATTFHNLQLNKSTNGAQLGQAIQVDNELQMTAGNLDLNGFDLTLGETAGTIIGESATSYIHGAAGGEIVKTLELNAPNAVNPGNIGSTISSAQNLESTTIRRGHQPQTIYGAESIRRYYNISPATNAGLSATLRMAYLEHELNGIDEAELEPLRNNGGSWEYHDVSTADANAKYVETTNVDAFSVWTLAAGAVKLIPVALLQGPYAGGGLMQDDLRSGGLLPTTEPYTALGYTHTGRGGGETVSNSIFDATGNDAIVDWVVLELRDKTDPTLVVASRSALLQRDGDIVGLRGAGPVSFPGVAADDYYLVVRHRNHLGVRSTGSVSLSALGNSYDFSTNSNNTLGVLNGIADLGDGRFGLYSGDYDANGQVQNTDVNGMIPGIGTAGYLPGDFNLNGQWQNTDLQLQLLPNVGKGAQFNY